MINYIKLAMLNKNNPYNQNDELKGMAPKLSEIKKRNPFKVPDNYFDGLQGRIQSQIEKEQGANGSQKVKSLFSQTRLIISLAAASVVIFISIFLFLNNGSDMPDYFSGITIDHILEESPELIEMMDDYLLVEVMLTANENLGDENYIDYMDFDSTLHTDDMINFLSDDEIETDLFYY
jgi:hypothetical protein